MRATPPSAVKATTAILNLMDISFSEISPKIAERAARSVVAESGVRDFDLPKFPSAAVRWTISRRSAKARLGGIICDTCPHRCRMSFRHDKNDSGLRRLRDIRRFSRSRFPQDSAESA